MVPNYILKKKKLIKIDFQASIKVYTHYPQNELSYSSELHIIIKYL